VCLEISNNLYRDKLITSTVDLGNQSVVSDRMIDLEFKEVLTDSKNNIALKYQKQAAKYKDVDIYANYKSMAYQPVGKASYTIIGQGVEFTKSQITKSSSYSQSKIERNYHSKKLIPTGSLVNKLI
jgi:hypothetical protein